MRDSPFSVAVKLMRYLLHQLLAQGAGLDGELQLGVHGGDVNIDLWKDESEHRFKYWPTATGWGGVPPHKDQYAVKHTECCVRVCVLRGCICTVNTLGSVFISAAKRAESEQDSAAIPFFPGKSI